jgi:hypothetical protein
MGWSDNQEVSLTTKPTSSEDIEALKKDISALIKDVGLDES